MQDLDLTKLSNRLYNARLNAVATSQLSAEFNFTEADAYEIQEMGIQERKNDGEKIIGMKMGLTSEAKRKQMNLHSPLYGVLSDKMMIENNGLINLEGLIHPKIEPEIAFVTSKELSGKISREEVIDACSGAFAAMEILDSRYEHFKYFSLEDVIADNSSSCLFVLGDELKDWKKLSVDNLTMKMYVNGELQKEGNSKEISGDPLISVIQLCELLERRGQSVPSGSIILTGAATTAIELKKGQDITLEVEGLGKVSAHT